jgi:hypothetical protein
MTINENLVLINASSIPIATELKMGDDVTIGIQGSVIKIEDSDNQDGTVNRTYKIKGIVGDVIKNGTKINEEEVW